MQSFLAKNIFYSPYKTPQEFKAIYGTIQLLKPTKENYPFVPALLLSLIQKREINS